MIYSSEYEGVVDLQDSYIGKGEFLVASVSIGYRGVSIGSCSDANMEISGWARDSPHASLVTQTEGVE